MPGTFDEIIKQQMARSQRSLGYQDARDRAARQINMRDRGINSTAFPYPGVAGAQAQGPAVPGPTAQFPPAPTMDSLIQQQMGETMPVPSELGPAPEQTPPPMDMGDASAAEAAQSDPAFQAAWAQAIAEQAGDTDTAQVTPPVNAVRPEAPTPGVASPQAQETGFDPTVLIATVAALGGTAGVASLIQRYRMGDPDAANTFRAIGISPDELAMFAGDVMPQRERGSQKAPKQDRPQPPRRNEGKKKPASQKQNAKANDGEAGKNVPATGRDRFKRGPATGTSGVRAAKQTRGIKPVRPRVKLK